MFLVILLCVIALAGIAWIWFWFRLANGMED